MPRFHYFAYGSNLLAERLTARCPSARVIGSVSVAGWRLAFQAKSFDGSGKATMLRGEDGDVVHGRLYEIAVADRDGLDRAEGADRDPPIYVRHDDFVVTAADGSTVSDVSVYLAREETVALPPWDWYRALIVAGAMQAELPAADVAALAVVPALADVLPKRKTRLEALRILVGAGYAELAKACGASVPVSHPTTSTASPTLDDVAERAVAEAISAA